MRFLTLTAGLVLGAALLTGGPPAVAAVPAAAAVPSAAAPAAVPHLDHIFLIIEENNGFRDVIGNPAAPNLNALARHVRPGHRLLRGQPGQQREQLRGPAGRQRARGDQRRRLLDAKGQRHPA